MWGICPFICVHVLLVPVFVAIVSAVLSVSRHRRCHNNILSRSASDVHIVFVYYTRTTLAGGGEVECESRGRRERQDDEDGDASER